MPPLVAAPYGRIAGPIPPGDPPGGSAGTPAIPPFAFTDTSPPAWDLGNRERPGGLAQAIRHARGDNGR